MNDAENITKLLVHLPPSIAYHFLTAEIGLALPTLDPKQGKRVQRAALEAGLAALPVRERQKIDEVAERIVLLSDGAGQDVVEGFREDIFDDTSRKAFAAIRNQYERALWLHSNAPAIFKEALDARQADVFRQSTSCYSGFIAPKHLAVNDDPGSRSLFCQTIAEQFHCDVADVAMQFFKRMRPESNSGEDVLIYQISIYNNRPPELVDCVQASELVPQEVIRAASSHITYEPANGHLEVLSRYAVGREVLARIATDCIFKSPFFGVTIPLKQYDYQSLAGPRNFDLSDENVSSVKVVELGYAQANHRSLMVKIWSTDVNDIHVAAQSLAGSAFDFRNHRLNYAKLSIRLKKDGVDRARTISVILRDDNKCNIKTKRERDRALCDRLLVKWHLVKEIGNGATAAVHVLAA
jgi:hypothetical protein